MRHKRVRALVLGCAVSFLLSACGAAVEDSPLAAVFPDQVSRMEASYFECGGMTTWELTQEEFEDLKSWALGLSLEEQTFDEGASPGDRDGGSGYTFQWGEHGFSYILSGDADYVLLEGTWYQVKNPSCPPLEIPGDSAVTAEDVETLEAYHYIVPAAAERKIVTDEATIQEVLDLLDSTVETNALPEPVTGGTTVSFRLYLASGEVEEWICEERADSVWALYGHGSTYETAADCAALWDSLPGESASAEEDMLPAR